MINNPFTKRKTIRNLKFFYGREQEIQHAIEHIVSGESCSIVGEPKIGKSSFLWNLRNALIVYSQSLASISYIVVYYDFQLESGFSQSSVLSTLLEELAEVIEDQLLREACLNLCQREKIRFSDLRRILLKVTEAGFKIVFLFDEFDNLASRYQEVGIDFFSGLRSLAGQLGIIYVTASRIGLHELLPHELTSGSPFSNIFQVINLGLLDEQSANSLVLQSKSPVLPSLENELGFILKYAGRHPFVLQAMCYFTFFLKERQNSLEEGELQVIANKCLDQLIPFFDEIWNNLSHEQKETLVAVLEKDKESKFLQPTVVNTLIKQGYLIIIDNSPLVFSRLFENYVETYGKQLMQQDIKLDNVGGVSQTGKVIGEPEVTHSTLNLIQVLQRLSRPQLRQLIVALFSSEELKTLCFDLGIDFDNIPGETKVNKAQEIIDHVYRRDMLSDFLKVAISARPNLNEHQLSLYLPDLGS